MMELQNLTIGYGSKVVASGVNARLMPGELVCLIGRNGSGKSTLMRTVTAFQPPLSGTVTLTGMPCDASAQGTAQPRTVAEMTARERSRTIGIVLTEKPDVENMTVRELVALGRAPYTGFWGTLAKEDHDIVTEALAMTGMGDYARRLVQTLSDGERQKVMIAKALAQQTPFIFLDEPTAFLDYPSKVETMRMLLRLCSEQRKAVVISTHDLDVALRFCHTVWLMKDGTLVVGNTTSLKGEIDDFMKA